MKLEMKYLSACSSVSSEAWTIIQLQGFILKQFLLPSPLDSSITLKNKKHGKEKYIVGYHG